MLSSTVPVSPLSAAVPLELPAGLEPLTAEVWLLDIDDVAPALIDGSSLDHEEQERAAKLRDPRHRARFVAAHTLLRQLLGRRAGTTPERIEFGRRPCPRCGGPHGRPALRWPAKPLHFSLSHSGCLVLVAIDLSPVGVDLEAFPERETWSAVGPLLHSAEWDEIAAAAPAEKAATFARLWARKEAYLKGEGTGIAAGLSDPAVGAENPGPAPPGWMVVDLPLPSGYAGALALTRRRPAVSR